RQFCRAHRQGGRTSYAAWRTVEHRTATRPCDGSAAAGSTSSHTTLPARILPAFGSKALDEVTPADVAALRQKMIAEKLSISSVNRHLAYVRASFAMAIKWQVIDGRNPGAAPGMLREEQRDHYLS